VLENVRNVGHAGFLPVTTELFAARRGAQCADAALE
jgi:hypothetical protein